ncbi:matrilin-4-like [Alosa pseudoharengus]|uniref:matrilin-4-like n=1 Tax=Alosa pseudoharengus TaxID=34774 RepID=UPI003F8B2910
MRTVVLGLFCLLAWPGACGQVRQKQRPRPLSSKGQRDADLQTNSLESQCKGKPLDFVFVIDSSRSVRPDDYEKVKTFILNVLSVLDVGADATRVGLLQYGSVVQSEFSLGAFTRRADVERAVHAMAHLASGTMTGLALRYTTEEAFSEEQGARPKAMQVPRVAMVVTDGRPQDTVEEAAAEARQAGIEIFAVGVGRVDMATLRAIGSEPHADHVFLVANFSQIETLTSVFQDKLCAEIDHCGQGDHGCEHECVDTEDSFVCRCRAGYTLRPDGKTCKKIDRCGEGDHGCEHECVNTDDSFVCRCRQGYTLTPDGKTCKSLDICQTVDHGCEHQCVGKAGSHSYVCICFEGYTLAENGKNCKKSDCGDGVMDLVFVIDGSKSLGTANFERVKRWVNDIVETLAVSRGGTRVGLIQYSTKVRTEFTLGQHERTQAIQQAVASMQYMGRGSMTGSALRHMFERSFSAAEGGRHGVPRVSIVFTDGRSQDDVSGWATEAKQAGVRIYAVGVGKAIEDELREIASEPDEKHLYYAEDLNRMEDITDKLKAEICQGKLAPTDQCECNSLVAFQNQAAEQIQKLTQKHILSDPSTILSV